MAIMKLQTPFTYSKYIKPVCMAAPNLELKFGGRKPVNCLVSGWGDTSGWSDFADDLGAAVLQFFPPLTCNCLYGGIEHESMYR